MPDLLTLLRTFDALLTTYGEERLASTQEASAKLTEAELQILTGAGLIAEYDENGGPYYGLTGEGSDMLRENAST